MSRNRTKVVINKAALRDLQRQIAEQLNAPSEPPQLTRFQRRELLWLASEADENGGIPSSALEERNASFAPESRGDLAARYRALERLGYVDELMLDWSHLVISARLTEEGRGAAEDILSEELASPTISEETRSSVKEALIAGGIGVACDLLIKLIALP